eukprot:jgi/Ulvmu1/11316/UM074_0031.1
MCQAIELLHVVQQDQGWQAAERQGGSLNGGAAALLSALQSPATEAAVMRADNHGMAACGGGGATLPCAAGPARSSSSGGGAAASGGGTMTAPRLKRSHAARSVRSAQWQSRRKSQHRAGRATRRLTSQPRRQSAQSTGSLASPQRHFCACATAGWCGSRWQSRALAPAARSLQDSCSAWRPPPSAPPQPS